MIYWLEKFLRIQKNSNLMGFIRIFLKMMRFIKLYSPSLHFLYLLKLLYKRKYEILYSHEISSLANASLAVYIYRIFSSNTNIKLIYDCHELESDRNPPRPKYLNCIISRLEKFYVHLGRAETVTVSQFIADELQQRFHAPAAVVWNIPLITDLSSGIEPLIHHPKIILEKRFLNCVMIGNLAPHRGVEQSLLLLDVDDSVCLHFVGKDPHNRYHGTFEKTGILEKYADRIAFHGEVPNDHLVNYIKKFDICIIPIQPKTRSYRFCAPNKLFEAAFANIPILYQYDGHGSSLVEIDRLSYWISDCFQCDFNDRQSVIQNLSKVRSRVGMVNREGLEYFTTANINYFKSLMR